MASQVGGGEDLPGDPRYTCLKQTHLGLGQIFIVKNLRVTSKIEKISALAPAIDSARRVDAVYACWLRLQRSDC